MDISLWANHGCIAASGGLGIFQQLSGASSLRRLVSSFNSQSRRLHHLGCEKVSRSTLADANASRPHGIFSGLFAALLRRGQSKLLAKAWDCVHLIDSTTVRLNRLSGSWSRFSEGVHGAKAHIIYDPDADNPIHAVITPENVNDISAAKVMPITEARRMCSTLVTTITAGGPNSMPRAVGS
jgi:hypothetical protein